MSGIKNLLGFASAGCKNSQKMFPAPKESPFQKNLLEGKVALVTGGASSLSQAIAYCFADHNASVIIADSKKPPRDVAKEVSDAVGREVGAVHLDPCSESSIHDVYEFIQAEYGKPCNLLINNSPIRLTAPSHLVQVEDIQRACDSIATSAFLMTKALYARNGHKVPTTVLNVTSNYAQSAVPFSTVSSMALAAVEAMTKSLSNEFAKGGLRINALAPASERYKEFKSVNQLAETEHVLLPIGRDVEALELAYTAAFLCSDYTNAMTGACITVDGGQRHTLNPNNFLHGVSAKEWSPFLEKQRGNAGAFLEPAEPSDADELLKFMQEDFLLREPVNQALGLTHENSGAFFRYLIEEGLASGYSMVGRNSEGKVIAMALVGTKQRPGTGDVKQPEIDMSGFDPNVSLLVKLLMEKLGGDMWSRVPEGHDRLLHSMVLSVQEKYGRSGLGTSLLRKMYEVGREQGFDGIIGEATAWHTQKLLAKLGWKVLKEIKYAEFLDEDCVQLIRTKDGTQQAQLVYRPIKPSNL